MKPAEREGTGGLWFGNSMIVIGGVNTKQYFDDVWKLDLSNVSYFHLSLNGQNFKLLEQVFKRLQISKHVKFLTPK